MVPQPAQGRSARGALPNEGLLPVNARMMRRERVMRRDRIDGRVVLGVWGFSQRRHSQNPTSSPQRQRDLASPLATLR